MHEEFPNSAIILLAEPESLAEIPIRRDCIGCILMERRNGDGRFLLTLILEERCRLLLNHHLVVSV
jgi:hypothetical protein